MPNSTATGWYLVGHRDDLARMYAAEPARS
jgi:hypothetical protein